VVLGKQFGAVWGARRVGLALLITWGVGVFLGAIHPLTVLPAAGFAAVAAWTAAAIGVLASSLARNSTRALVATFLVLLLLLNFWPTTVAGVLMSPGQVAAPASPTGMPGAPALTMIPPVLALILVNAAGAGALTTWSIRRLGRTWGKV
jgi:hypothetical protein